MTDAAAQLRHPSQALFRLPDTPRPPPIYTGLDELIHAGTGVAAGWFTHPGHFLRSARRAETLSDTLRSLTDADLGDRASTASEPLRLARADPAHIEAALAVIRESARRELGQSAFPEQLAGAMAIHAGCIAEMSTGEGKTLAAVHAAALWAWRGRGCHVVTANDYLARRDAQWMAPVFRRLGLSVACVTSDTPAPRRRDAYAADITYTTNKELAADYLRDRLAHRHRGVALLRGLHHAVIDEADFVLIDDAVTPLILSSDDPETMSADDFRAAARAAAAMIPGVHYRADHAHRECTLTPAGRIETERLTSHLTGVWSSPRRREELVTQAIEAREYFRLGREFVVRDDRVVIVDESTGRLMPDRTWRAGVHQAVEALHQLPITPVKSTHARITFQRFFRLYRRLGGMTGTAREARAEFWSVYRRRVVTIPTHRPCRRDTFPAVFVPDQAARWERVAREAENASRAGRPVLIGTRSVAESESASAALTARAVAHEVLNAERSEREAAIISGAGVSGRVTVATNMAGRGTDIIPDTDALAAGGLLVISTARHEARRIDRQLAGRTARQGDPGSTLAIISLDDDLLRRHAGALVRVIRRLSPALAFALAQRRAERFARRQRRDLLLHDDWLDDNLAFAGAP